MTNQKKLLKAKCKYCKKEIFSLYENQLKHNVEVHEVYCPIRIKEEKGKEKNNEKTNL